MRQQGWFQHSMVEEGKGNGNPNQNQELGKNLPSPTPPKSSLTQQDDSSMFRVPGCWLGETSHCCIKPSISDVRFPPLSRFMFSECSSYNLDCFSVLRTYPEVTCDQEVTWNRGEISERGVSEGPTLQGEVEEEAVCNLPICLCEKTGSGPKVLGHGIPWVACDQTSVGNPAGGSSEAWTHQIFDAWNRGGACREKTNGWRSVPQGKPGHRSRMHCCKLLPAFLRWKGITCRNNLGGLCGLGHCCTVRMASCGRGYLVCSSQSSGGALHEIADPRSGGPCTSAAHTGDAALHPTSGCCCHRSWTFDPSAILLGLQWGKHH